MVTHKPLEGSKRGLLPGSRPAGPIDPNEIASITVRVRSQEDPANLINQTYDLAQTPLEKRQYLSADDLKSRFGASKADLDTVEQYAQTHHLFVVKRNAAERSIGLRGKLGDLLGAFPANVALYHHEAGTYRGRQGQIMVPSELKPIITGIFGFDTRPRFRAKRRMRTLALAGPGGQNGVASTSFAARYNFPPGSGAGQTIAIIELGGGYQNSDLQTYFSEINTPLPNVTWVSVDSGTNTTGSDADTEVLLDIEVAGAVVPAANIVVYFAGPSQGDKGFIDAVSTAVYDQERAPSVVSISWGGPEDFVDQQSITAFNEIFAAAGSQGITICVASGDHGTADLPADKWDQQIHVDHPASDPMVLACGGTEIDQAGGSDVIWNDGTQFNVNTPDGGGWASGGGISVAFPVPSYQAGQAQPVSLVTNQPGRAVPDISMSATNYFERAEGQEFSDGGTSAVAPLMAALVARLNQQRGVRVGFLNPPLYAHAATMTHPIGAGSIGTNGLVGTVQGYPVGPGCTGLGTPDGTAILNGL